MSSVVTGGRVELAEYLKRVAGYLLTGLQTEQCVFILFGPGGCGKSTWWKVIRMLLGDYAGIAAKGLFVESKHENNDGSNPTPGLADLVGKRAVMSSEMKKGQKFNVELMKSLTGDSEVKARNPHGQLFSFESQAKPVFLTNHIPTSDDFTGGFEDRLRIIRFDQRFRDTPQEIKDYHLQFIPELPGILNWALEGLREYIQAGDLQEPQIVKDDVKQYMAEQDGLSRWHRDCCEKSPDSTPVKDIVASYKTWAAENGEKADVTPKEISTRLIEMGYKPGKHRGVRDFTGFRLRTPE